MTNMFKHCNMQFCSLRETGKTIFLDFQIEIKMLGFTKDVK